jgi:hypothetical protein
LVQVVAAFKTDDDKMDRNAAPQRVQISDRKPPNKSSASNRSTIFSTVKAALPIPVVQPGARLVSLRDEWETF